MAVKRLPKKMRLGSHEVSVKIVPAEVLSEKRDSDGDCDSDALEIRVAAGLPPTRAAEVILHEVTHFLLTGLPIRPSTEETIAVAMGNGLTSFFRDNPRWVDRLKKMARGE